MMGSPDSFLYTHIIIHRKPSGPDTEHPLGLEGCYRVIFLWICFGSSPSSIFLNSCIIFYLIAYYLILLARNYTRPLLTKTYAVSR